MSFRVWIESNIPATVAIVAVALLILYQIIFALAGCIRKYRTSVQDKHVLITGGSKGLGLELAREFRRLGAHVTIMARNVEVLNRAKEDLLKSPGPKGDSTVLAISADVTDVSSLERGISECEKALGPIDILVPCAGSAPTGYFWDHSMDVFRRSMELNYFGVVAATRVVARGMMKRRSGHILFVSSALGLTAYIGYSAYCPAKFAVRGFADALRSELLSWNIKVYSAFPPGMHTPGFETEEKTKPEECKAIEKGEPVYEPEDVAKSIISSFRKGEYYIACGDFGTSLLTRTAAGLVPRNNTVADICILPFGPLIAKVYSWLWDREARRFRPDSRPASKTGQGQGVVAADDSLTAPLNS